MGILSSSDGDATVLTLHAGDPETTRQIGIQLGAAVPDGAVISLEGPLGAGKTWLAGGIARGVGVPEQVRVTSPTYTILNIYDRRERGEQGDPGARVLYHMDLYRLGDEDDESAHALGIAEQLLAAPTDGITVVEWLDLRPDLAPAVYLRVRIFGVGDAPRRLELDLVSAGGQESELSPLREALRSLAGEEKP